MKEGRLLLHDWLVIFTAQYNDAYKIVEFGKPGTTSSLDVAFSHCPQLQSFTLACLARLIDSILHGFLHIPFCFRFRAVIFHGFCFHYYDLSEVHSSFSHDSGSILGRTFLRWKSFIHSSSILKSHVWRPRTFEAC